MAVISTFYLPAHVSVLLPQLFCYWFLLVYFSFQLLWIWTINVNVNNQWLFFSFSRSLLNISCIFSIHASILFLRSWIIFTILLWVLFQSLFPLKGRATSGGLLWGGCELIMTLGSLSADGWGCVPFLLVVWCEVSSTGACRQLGRAGFWCQDGYLQFSSRVGPFFNSSFLFSFFHPT